MATDLSQPGQAGHAYALSILRITACSLTIVAVPAVFIWWWFFQHLKVPGFRHVLIWCYLTAEFLEAIVMIIYPCVCLKSNPYLSVVRHSAFCDTMGTLTMMTLEYSDFAVFLLAVHTALVVFSPRCCQGHGLYRFRHSVGFFYFFIPCVFAVICLIPFSSEVRSAYDHLISECYFRFFPRWYRYVFSWAPRLFIMQQSL